MPAGEVGDNRPRFLRDEDAGADVPRFQPHFKEAVNAVGGDEAQIERSRTEAAHVGNFRQHRLQNRVLARHQLRVAEGKTGGDDGAAAVTQGTDPQLASVQLRAFATRGGEPFLRRRVINDAQLRLAALDQTDGNGELRQAVQKIGGTVQRVNHPAEFAFFRLGAGFAELFAEEIVLREFLQQDILDDFFSAAIHDAHQIAAPLFFYLDLGIPLTLISEAVFARCVSAFKDQRVQTGGLFGKTISPVDGDKAAWVEALRQALLASKIISYAQGFMLIREASENNDWALNYGNTALLWREGCIIRSAFLGNIRDAYEANPDLVFLGSDPYFKGVLENCLPAWRKVVAKAIECGIPMPCMASAITFLDGYTTERLPANLLQAQRDYFGAHTYERTDKPRGEFFHTNWTGKGGDTASTTYDI